MSKDLSQRRQRRSAIQIAPDLWRIPLGGGTVNAYLLRTNGDLTLVDCGYPGGGHRLATAIDSLGFSISQLRTIVLTHSDLDHAGALSELLGMSNASVMAHALEIDLVSGKARRSWPDTVGGRLLARSYPRMINRSRQRNGHSFMVQALEDGQHIDGWTVVHSPGHTPGHIALMHEESGSLIAGDALGWRRGKLAGPSPLYATDLVQAVQSVRRLADLGPRTLLFGHRAPAVDPSGEALDRLAGRLERQINGS